MIGKTIAGLAAALTFAMTATVATAGPAGVGGGAGSIGAMGAFHVSGIAINMRAIGGGNGRSSGTGPAMNGLQFFPFPTNDPNHYHEIRLVGRLTKDESGLTIDQQIVRMRVDGREIPMSINGDTMSNSLQLDQGDELGQSLYRLILSKRLEVVGDQKLRTQLANAAAANPSKPVAVDGFVYDRMTPYLVLVSVGDAP
ncbi:MAG TPA: hypothetical protein VJX68_13455 [Candidatus Binatus sp.]|uniref:hypothetical protein n=1 Tax=Candidatus Binatus sp. TaxID=2811406 RepID=UPI002B45A967|nr:hypothetical protein [Candidatus Binatus sp.]HKN14192.1 hypothetical protein [Candidatus Binatus sp.]